MPQSGEGRAQDKVEQDGVERVSAIVKLRNLAPIFLGIGLFALGAYALHRLLQPLNAAEVISQVKSTPWSELATAMAATVLGYVALIGYDWSALRSLGKKVPARIVAVGGFLGYSFGNTIGISIISGGAVRYRIYSAFGLNAFEVAAVSTFVALAFGFGITVIGLVALAIHPHALQAILPFPGVPVQFIAASSALILTGVLTWLSVTQKTLRISRFEISAPSPGILYGQLGFTLMDTAMAALTLYVLMPVGVPDFLTFLTIFAAAVMAGVLSHVPGGVGVFESVIIAGLPGQVPLEQVAAALVLYRMIYYLVPFGLALAFVAINEARLAGGFLTRLLGDVPEQLKPILKSAITFAPSLAGSTVFGLGVYLLIMALMPSVRPHQIDPNDLLATILLEGGAILSATLGIALLMLSQGLVRRISGAFWLTGVALIGGAVASVLNGLDIESAILLLLFALILWPFKSEFYRSAKLTKDVLTPSWFALVFAIIIGVSMFFFFIHKATPYSTELLTQFSSGANTPRALRAALLASAMLILVTIYVALQPARTHVRQPSAVVLERARSIIAEQQDPEAYLALSCDKSVFLSDEQDAFIMYGVQGKSWISYSDPVGAPDKVAALAWAFFEDAYVANSRPIFYEVSEKYMSLWVEMGLTLHKIGEEALVSLPGFSLAGGAFKKMRAAHNKAVKSGLEFELRQPPHSPEFMAQLKGISDAWLGQKKSAEKGFSVGRFSNEYLAQFPMATVRRNGKLLAFANVLRPKNSPKASIDLMRYLPEEASGMMEFLFVSLLAHFRDQGAQEFSLGMAPLSGIESRPGTHSWNRFGALIFRHGSSFYNFKGLRAFKQKFHPDWHPRYLAIPGGTPPLVALKDVAFLIAGHNRNPSHKETSPEVDAVKVG
ncbi:MAG: bifunctional lysylphosphatidylglycerol flippase/synthetase MprF [Alphaproteobacteria bacterium]|nr:bifunctional lysylphosphatidylglycerol flippase/synthetase MprF [Alphaproteobacteria bacterium]